MQKNRKTVVAITGASGSYYAFKLLEKMEEASIRNEDIALIISRNGKRVCEYEIGENSLDKIVGKYRVFDNDDFMAPFASGSSSFDTLIVVPCSMGALARIASGIASDLISRTADVMLKERRRLILVVREMPLNLIHIENMLKITQAGGIICPASPSFYFKPDSIDSLLSTVTERIMTIAGIDCQTKRFLETFEN
ncbi:MAG: UbiX family flavin prenyltransferase [Prevotellaceae bacterium]|jgi:4-hydroxy-3-polyprenylbenzoate decarboxylase|nr:UbiX family flavin prenyltransferase [Prevotellaceae bacterium]